MRRAFLGAVALLAATATATAAATASVQVPIPGLAAGSIRIAGALRTDDGGALVAAWLRSSDHAARGRLALARLRFDGALALGYGSEGVSAPGDPRLAAFRPTSLAIDPATGAAWVGGVAGGAGEVVAVDGAGPLARRFGARGVLRLPVAEGGGPVALAWRPGRLLLASGDRPCAGCWLSLRDPSTGRLLRAARLQTSTTSAGTCPRGTVTGAIFGPGSSEIVATRRSSGCPGGVSRLDAQLRPLQAWFEPPPASLEEVSGGPAAACAAARSGGRWLIAPLLPRPTAGVTVTATHTGLVALVPIGANACAALLWTAGGGARVVQGDARGTTTVAVPRSLVPLGMFRCHEHLLVIASSRSRRAQAAEIYPVALARGPYVRRAAAAAGTGCR